jgi:hypothetical protein
MTMKMKHVCVCILASAVPLFAADIQVPDLETRIRNTGSTVPSQAVPEIAPPLPVPLPPAPAVQPDVPLASRSAESGLSLPPEDQPPSVIPATPPAEPAVNGHASVGAGWPGSVEADVLVAKAAGSVPGFRLSALHASRSVFGRANNGVWSRKTGIDASVSEKDASGWRAGISLAEESNGFQGLNPAYASLSSRAVSFGGSSGAIPVASFPVSASVSLAGDIFSLGADTPGSIAASVPIADYGAYSLAPILALSFAKDSFSARLSGAYTYDAVSGAGETHSGSGTLTLGYAPGSVAFAGSVGAHGDSADGVLVPFELSLSWTGAKTPVRRIFLSGGLSSDRNAPWSPEKAAPFAAVTGKPIYSADWNGAFGISLAPLADLSFDAGVAYRTTAFGRGVLAVADIADSTTGWRFPVVRENRRSVVTTATMTVTESFWRVSAGYEGEWLDRLYRQSMHSFRIVSTIFDPSSRRLWDVAAASVFFFDGWQVPELSVTGALHPWKGMTVSVGLTDGIPLLSGVARKTDRVFLSADGAVTVSARIDF